MTRQVASDMGHDSISIRMPAWQVWVTGVAACGFFAPEFFLHPTRATLTFYNFFGVVFTLITVTFYRNRIFVRGGVAGTRGLVTKTVYLDYLTSVAVYRSRGKARYWRLELQDSYGHKVGINFDGLNVDDRLRWFAAVGPYVRRAGVSCTGPVEEALAGELWWPRPPGEGGKPRSPGKQHDPPRHARDLKLS
jgi:hypothetical protein